MDLISLAYTSRARPGLTTWDVDDILRSARTYNVLDGVTGLLVWTGDTFLQILEGAEPAIDAVFARIERDNRHNSIVIRDRSMIERRAFADWAMRRIDVTENAGIGPVIEVIDQHVDGERRDAVMQALKLCRRL